MPNWKHFYLFKIEFLGFRYHGWQKQPNLKTVQGMVDKTFKFILDKKPFKTLGAGRTDAKVSADDFAFELFTDEAYNLDELLILFNKNLPPDIRAKSIKEVHSGFNIINDPKLKEYHYYFSYGEKFHPFNAPYLNHFREELDIELMKKAAQEFIGCHNFKQYTCKPSEKTIFEREIVYCSIENNSTRTGAFFPEESFVFKVRSKGFLRYQVRMMIAGLIDVGNGTWTLEDFKQSLLGKGEQVRFIAPSSGLTLHKVDFE